MATIPNLAPQPQEQPEQTQQFKPQLEADVQIGCTIFKMTTTPLNASIQLVPDYLMVGVVKLWLERHPEEAVIIMRDLKHKIKNHAAIMNTVQNTRND